MSNKLSYDAVIVGSGPNGLAAALRLAREGLSVLVLEANPQLGGGTSSAELTLPGYVHDLCSAVHPLAVGSPFFRTLSLERQGLHWVYPPAPLAHPLDDGSAAVLSRSLEETAAALGSDRVAYTRLMSPFLQHWQALTEEALQPLLHVPVRPWLMARFGLKALRSAAGLANRTFTGEPARALFAGLSGHSFLRLEAPGSAAVGLVLGMMAHAVGWPIPRGGAQHIANALAASLRELGGELVTNCRVTSLDQLPLARAILLDLTPRQIVRIAGEKLPVSYRERLERFRYGPGVFKIDFALAAPIPWKTKGCQAAGTVHLGGTLPEIAMAEQQVCEGRHPEKPFVLLSQPSRFDPSRAPTGRHTVWAYCHVPNGSTVDMKERIESQIERFAPGFRDVILARHTSTCADLERANANLVGGDINGGVADLRQLLARPRLSATPYRTPVPGLYICSASTPPGGGVHGMCGLHAAEAALREIFRLPVDRGSSG